MQNNVISNVLRVKKQLDWREKVKQSHATYSPASRASRGVTGRPAKSKQVRVPFVFGVVRRVVRDYSSLSALSVAKANTAALCDLFE